MSRIPDLLSLIESTNDFFLVAPGRNDRSVYIQVDDICELAMKSWLYEDSLNRQAQVIKELALQGLVSSNSHRNALRDFFGSVCTHHQLKQRLSIAQNERKRRKLNMVLRQHGIPKEWSADKERGFKSFVDVVGEVKALRLTDNAKGGTVEAHEELHKVLDNLVERRNNRNAFFHDHKQTGLTISQQSCLGALIDLYRLCQLLYGDVFLEEIEKPAWAVCRLQIVTIRIRYSGATRGRSLSIYEEYLRKQKSRTITPAFGIYEYRLLHEDASAMYEGIKTEFDQFIIAQKQEVERLEGIKRPTTAHIYRKQQAESAVSSLTGTWQDCFGKEWKPVL